MVEPLQICDTDLDPNKLTTFGAPPVNTEEYPDITDEISSGTRIGAIFGAVASVFRRKEEPRKSESSNQLEVQSNAPSEDKSPEVRDHTDSISGSSDVPAIVTPPVVPKSPQKMFTSLFRKDRPVSIGLNTKWANDDACHHCYSCSSKFSTFFRRHHCRFCGRIFCDSCSKFRVPGQPFGAKDALRSCEVCYRETLRSLLETHYESLSEDMLQKVASLYAMVSSAQYQGVHQQSQSSTAASSSSTSATITTSKPCPQPVGLTSVVRSNSTAQNTLTDDSTNVIYDPLRHAMERRMTKSEIIVNTPWESGDEDEQNDSQYNRSHTQNFQDDDLPQFSDLKQLFEKTLQPDSAFPFETKRSFAKTFYHCFSGKSLLKWLISRDQELTSFQAAAIAKAMLDFDIIVPLEGLSNTDVFAMGTYYRPGRAAGFMPIAYDRNLETAKQGVVRTNSGTKGQSVAGSNSGNIGNRATTNTTAPRIVATTATKTNQMNVQLDAAVGESLQKNFAIKERLNELLPYRANDVEASLRRLYKMHLSRLCADLLGVDGLDSEKWQQNLLQIVYQVVRIIKPRPREYPDALDIRRCVKIKKIYDSSLAAHFEYVDGYVFTKSLALRQMRTPIQNPRLLLLQTGLDFERNCRQLTTLDVVVHQEGEQAQRDVAQIKSLSPDVLLCGGSIPTMARQELLASNITAASFVKAHILEQVARYTRASILSSIDSLSLSGFGQIRLGTCRSFASFSVHMHKRLQKTFLCFSGCDPIGCTLLVRDSNFNDLIKVKRILKLLILAAYDGLVLSQYLISIRANPQSLDLPPSSKCNNDKVSTTNKSDESDNLLSIPGSNTRKLQPLKRSKSANRNSPSPILNEFGSNLAALDLSFSSAWSKLNLSAMDAAFSLANSGLLSLSPLIKLSDPLKKAGLFEQSKSRIYFESSLFSLFGSSYIQGKKPLDIPNPSPPKWVSNCVPRSLHAFFTTPLTGDLQSPQTQRLLVSFRRDGFLFDIISDHKQKRLVPKTDDRVDTDEPGVWVKSLSVFECQSLHVLTSTFSLDSQLAPFRHCDGPRLVSCPFHARSDLSLGAFLENQCFIPTTTCPRRGCGALLIDHVRRFASNYGSVEIVVRPLAEPIHAIVALSNQNAKKTSVEKRSSDEDSGCSSLVTWAMCRICRAVTPFAEVSDNIWGMSLASFLQLKFYGVDFTCVQAVHGEGEKCSHPFGKSYLQFFAKGNLVAVVKYSSINVHDVIIPPPMISLEAKLPCEVAERHETLMKYHEILTQAIMSHFDIVQSYLENCRTHLLCPPGSSVPTQPAVDLMTHSEEYLADQRQLFVTKMAALELAITDPGWKSPGPGLILRMTEQVTFEIFQSVSQSWLEWNDQLKNLIRILRSQSSSNEPEIPVVNSNSAASAASPIPIAPASGQVTPTNGSYRESNSEQTPEHNSQQISLGVRLSSAVQTSSTSKSNLGKQVLEFLTDAELFKQGIFKTKLKLPLKAPFDPNIHYVFRGITLVFPIAINDNEPSTHIAFAMSTEEYFQKLEAIKSSKRQTIRVSSPAVAIQDYYSFEGRDRALGLSEGMTDNEDDGDGDDEDEELQLDSELVGQEDQSTVEFGSTLDPVKTISMKGVRPKFASRRPVLDTVRFVAPQAETSSLPSSPQQKPKNPSNEVPGNSAVSSQTRLSTGQQPVSQKPTDTVDFKGSQRESQQEIDPHIRITWTDAAVNKDSVTKFTVTIYYAAVFAELRSFLVEKGDLEEESDVRSWLETSLLRSLSRCVTWTAPGGKSGQRFFRTADGRLIIKQLHKDEWKTMLKVAPDYASGMRAAREQNRPSALVPILGLYNVTFENGCTGRSSKFDIVLQLNLFRNFTITDKFDLKGSERNRLVKKVQSPTLDCETPESERSFENVLMDENLLIRSLQDPLYVHPHSKQLLLQAIAADTQFLVRNSVIDYSLLVGIDPEKRCLVVGIIDYLRTFTFDKKLEYVVKSTGLLGGQGKAPTILYPNKYRDRFLSAMRQFFLEVPDNWLPYETHNLRLASQS